MCCFLENFTQLAQILHDRRSRRSLQISTVNCDTLHPKQIRKLQFKCSEWEREVSDVRYVNFKTHCLGARDTSINLCNTSKSSLC